MNIMLLINSLTRGGAEKLNYDIAERIDKRENSVSVCSVGAIDNDSKLHIKTELEKRGVHVLSLHKRPKRDRIPCVMRLWVLLRQYRIDVLQTNCQSPDFYGRMASIFARRTKVVTCIHNTRGYSARRELLMGRLTDRYIAVSKEVYGYCIKVLHLPPSKVTLIENGIDMDRYHAIPGEGIKAKPGLRTEDYVVITVGRFVEQKGYRDMCLVMKRFMTAVSYTHLRAHETRHDLVCR